MQLIILRVMEYINNEVYQIDMNQGNVDPQEFSMANLIKASVVSENYISFHAAMIEFIKAKFVKALANTLYDLQVLNCIYCLCPDQSI